MSSNLVITAPGGGGSGGGGGGAMGGSGGGGSSGGGSSGPCGACKFLRRKCVAGCIFAPYFDSEQGSAHFAAVHKVFGASNVSKMLQHVPVHKRLDAVVTICYEAQARLRNPVYGCVAHIFALQQQLPMLSSLIIEMEAFCQVKRSPVIPQFEVVNLQGEIAYLQAHLTNLELQPSATAPPPPHHPPPPHFSVSDLPTASAMPATYDLSSLLFDPVLQWPQPMHHQASDMHNAGHDQYVTLAIPQPSDNHASNLARISSGAGPSGSGGDVQAGLGSGLLLRHGSSSAGAGSSGTVLHGSSTSEQAQRPSSSSQPK